jgi:hypothetical protein
VIAAPPRADAATDGVNGDSIVVIAVVGTQVTVCVPLVTANVTLVDPSR